MARAKNLQEEIRQSKPFQSPYEEAFLSILRTADLLRHQANELVVHWELTEQQYNVLRILRGAGEVGLPTLEIASRMIERTPGITRLLDRLEKKRLIRRFRSKDDRRQVICHITAAGLTVLGDLDEPTQNFTTSALSVLSRDEARALIALLERVRSNS